MITSNWFNFVGIILELVGFGIILVAVRALKPEKRSFSMGWNKAENLMSTLHPRWNTVGICLVIAGLLLQLVGSVI